MKNILYNNKQYSIKDFSILMNLKYNTFRQFILRNNYKEELNYNNINFKLYKKDKNITTLINNLWKRKEDFYINGKFNTELVMDYWLELVQDNPSNLEYKDYYDFLLENYERYGDNFDYFNTYLKWRGSIDLWECDTETTYTSEIPFDFLFKNPLKNFGSSLEETVKNLHVKSETDKSKIDLMSIVQIKQETKKGIREWFKENPDKKPYMWAWNCMKFKDKKYHLFNYYDAIKYLDELNKNQTHWYHNLSYDAYYVWNALIDEKGYEMVEYDIENMDKIKFNAKLQPEKTIYVFANNKKIMFMRIKNSKGKVIICECSYFKCMASIADLGKTLNKPKLDLNYLKQRTKNHVFDDIEKAYIRTDVEIAVDYFSDINKRYKESMKEDLDWKITIGATALNELKRSVGEEEFAKLFGRKINLQDEVLKEFKQLAIDTNNKCFDGIYFKDFITNKYNKYLENFRKKKIKKYKNEIPFDKYRDNFIKMVKEWENPIKIKADTYTYLKDFYMGGFSHYNIKYVGNIYYNISSLDIKSSYPANWLLNISYGEPIYECLCDNNDLNNNSEHFKLFEVKIKNDKRIKYGYENMIPFFSEFELMDGEYRTNDYFPYILAGDYKWDQYLLLIFLNSFNLSEDDYEIKKTMCFKHKVIPGFKKHVEFWKAQKEIPGLKNINPSYRDLTKLFLNSPYGKFGQKPILDETYFYIDENKHVVKEVVKEKTKLEDISYFKYLPVAMETTSLARLRLFSLMVEIGFDRWITSDTDSIKVWLPEEYKPEYNPTYLNLITGERETIYNEKGKDDFGKWELEWTSERFMCCGKKKYIYEVKKGDKIVKEVKCAGAPKSVRDKLNFDNFFVGYDTIDKDKTMVTYLNGLPVLLPTTFKVKNVFKSKFMIMTGYKHLLHDYYWDNVNRINRMVEENSKKVKDEIINYMNLEYDALESERGVYV